MSVQTISMSDCARLVRDGKPMILIDVRSPAEYDRVHAQGARLMPLDKLKAGEVAALRRDPAEPVYFICHSGGRSGKACTAMNDAGVANIFSVEGGTGAWEAAGLPVTRGSGKVISLERQVRIVAGSLVLVGVVLALTVHIAFAGLSAFIGAGLLFAGITDFCGMGILLSKMPWNQRGAQAAPCVMPVK
jgi:rhodanese-related sulfurtransferase